MKKVFFPGSFNPFTKGHADIVERLFQLFDFVIIGIGINIEKPSSEENAEKNASEIENWIERHGLQEKAKVIIYSGITAQEALKNDALCLSRGIRNATDFDYEFSLACLNKEIYGIETLLIPADPALSFISSTALRDLEKHGCRDIASRYKP